MSVVAPVRIPWTALEDAIHDWIAEATGIPGDRVTFVEDGLTGPALGSVPSAQIQPGALVPISQAGRHELEGHVVARATVTGPGPGSAGVLFYAGDSLDAQAITIIAGVGDDEATIAAQLLAELQAELPAGYSATASGPTTILVEGSEAAQLFAASGDGLVAVTIVREHRPRELTAWRRVSWRVVFRARSARGDESASALMGAAEVDMRPGLAKRLAPLGWRLGSVLLAAPQIPADRGEARAALDFAVEGYAAGITQDPAIRQLAATG